MTRRTQPPLQGAARADVAIVGGGFVGLWTAIRIKERDPACDVVVLEQDVCGGGASGRNGGEVLSWWAKAGKLVDLCGREEAIRDRQRVGRRDRRDRASSAPAHGIDADFTAAATCGRRRTEAQLGAWDSHRRAAARAGRAGARAARAGRGGAPRRLAGAPRGRARPERRHRAAGEAGARPAARGARARRAPPRAHARDRTSTAAARRCCGRRRGAADGRPGRDRHQRLGRQPARAAHAGWS